MKVDGCGGSLKPGPLQLDVAQSGTTSRFLLAVLAIGHGPYVLDGHPQLRARPFGPLAEALRHLGAGIDGDRLPITVAGGRLRPGSVEISGTVSSQFLSGLLLAAPYAHHGRASGDGDHASGAVTVHVPDALVSRPYVELTTATMAAFGVDVSVGPDGSSYTVPRQCYQPRSLTIEPDASAASYLFAAAAITGGRVRIPALGHHTVQGDLRFVDLLEQMGAVVTRGPNATEVRGTGVLRGIDVDMSDISDTVQTLAVVATFADGPTRIRNVEFIEQKETARLSAVVGELGERGIRAERTADGVIVHPGPARPGVVRTFDDHRMAMSFALLGLVHPGIELDDPDCVNKTFPRFYATLDELRG